MGPMTFTAIKMILSVAGRDRALNPIGPSPYQGEDGRGYPNKNPCHSGTPNPSPTEPP